MTIFLMAVMVSPVQALSDSHKTVRVAYPLQERITDTKDNGGFSRYTYEYLEEIAQHTGWSYEFVQVPGTEDEQITTLMDMVKNGEVDLIGGMLYSEQMAEEYQYCGSSYGMVETVLQALATGGENVMGNAFRTHSIRVAVQSATGRLAQDLEEYCLISGITPLLVECESEDEMIQALEDGRADAVLSTSMRYSDALSTVASFSPRQFYFISAKDGSSDLLTELSEAIASINRSDPSFQSALAQKYFAPQTYQLILSKEEEDYIQNAQPLSVGVLTNRPPFQYRDKADGKLKGIGVELLEHISEKTGLQFILVEADSQQQLYDMADSGQVDLIAGMPYDYTVAREQNLSMTRPYSTSQYILLLNKRISEDNINGKRLALSRASTYHGYFVGNPLTYDSVDDCVRAVNSGDADYTYVDAYTAQYYLNLPEFERLKMVPQTYSPAKTCFGIASPSHKALFGILNKSIMSMTMEELQSIIFMNTLQKQTFSITYFIRENTLPVVLILAGIFALILLLLLIILHQRSKAGKAISMELQRHLRLYAVSNDLIFEYDYKKKSLMLSVPEGETDNQRILYHDLESPREDAQEEQSRKAMQALLRSRESRISEERFFCSDRKWHWFRIVLETICDEAGTPVYAIGRLNMIDAERSERDQLLEQAQRDSLTHLYNIESSRKLIEKSLSSLREGEVGALLILDIDFFKSINDTYGHMRGDDMLRAVAGLLSKCFRSEDIVGRPGGDEFMVYMKSVRDQEALGEKCAAVCEKVRQVTLDTQRHLTVSLGAVLAGAGQNYAELYRLADQALYAAKDAGRDGYQLVNGFAAAPAVLHGEPDR